MRVEQEAEQNLSLIEELIDRLHNPVVLDEVNGINVVVVGGSAGRQVRAVMPGSTGIFCLGDTSKDGDTLEDVCLRRENGVVELTHVAEQLKLGVPIDLVIILTSFSSFRKNGLRDGVIDVVNPTAFFDEDWLTPMSLQHFGIGEQPVGKVDEYACSCPSAGLAFDFLYQLQKEMRAKGVHKGLEVAVVAYTNNNRSVFGSSRQIFGDLELAARIVIGGDNPTFTIVDSYVAMLGVDDGQQVSFVDGLEIDTVPGQYEPNLLRSRTNLPGLEPPAEGQPAQVIEYRKDKYGRIVVTNTHHPGSYNKSPEGEEDFNFSLEVTGPRVLRLANKAVPYAIKKVMNRHGLVLPFDLHTQQEQIDEQDFDVVLEEENDGTVVTILKENLNDGSKKVHLITGHKANARFGPGTVGALGGLSKDDERFIKDNFYRFLYADATEEEQSAILTFLNEELREQQPELFSMDSDLSRDEIESIRPFDDGSEEKDVFDRIMDVLKHMQWRSSTIGNAGESSAIFALFKAIAEDRIHPGDRVVFYTVGVGNIVTVQVLEFPKYFEEKVN